MSVKEYIKARLVESGAAKPREDKAKFTVFIAASLHEKLQSMADVLGVSKTSLASDVLEVAIMDFDDAYPVLSESKGIDPESEEN